MALASFQLKQQLEVGPDVYVFKLGSSCDGSVVAAATSENTVCVLDPGTLQPVRTLHGHGDLVEDLSFFQALPHCLASCSQDGSARVWDLRADDADALSFNVSSSEAYSCAVGRADSALACTASEKIHLFDIRAAKRWRSYKDWHTDVVNQVRFHPLDTSKMLSGAEDNLVVIINTDEEREDEAMIGCVPNDESVRSFTLVGPARETLCCASTTEDVRVFGLGAEDCGVRRAEFLGLRQHPLLMREDEYGYVVETFYDQPSMQVFLLAGAGNGGDLLLFRITLDDAAPVAGFALPEQGVPSEAGGLEAQVLKGHSGIVRSALSGPGGILLTAGEDGCICAWREEAEPAAEQFGIEPSAYGVARAEPGRSHRAMPY